MTYYMCNPNNRLIFAYRMVMGKVFQIVLLYLSEYEPWDTLLIRLIIVNASRCFDWEQSVELCS